MKFQTSSDKPTTSSEREPGEQSGFEIQNENVFDTVEETQVEEIKNPLNKKIRDRIEELTEQGKSVVHPTNESDWNQALLDRLNK